MSTTNTAKQIAPFKSDRAAKMAMTRANAAYEQAMGANHAKLNEISRRPDYEAWSAERAATQAALDAAFAFGQAVYAQAKAQGFYVRSYWFGPNTTRDLITANMD